MMIKKVIFSASVMLAALLVIVAAVAAQTPTPTPVLPRPGELPEIVSRDDVPETVTEDVRKVPTETERRASDSLPPGVSTPALPASTSSPYNIKLTEAQQKMMLYLDLLSKSEVRAEGLRSKLFEMIEKENSVRNRLSQIEYELRPDRIQNSAALTGSLRPEDVRADRQNMLEADKRNQEALLNQIAASRSSLEQSIISADRLVARIREKFDAFVEAALIDDSDL